MNNETDEIANEHKQDTDIKQEEDKGQKRKKKFNAKDWAKLYN